MFRPNDNPAARSRDDGRNPVVVPERFKDDRANYVHQQSPKKTERSFRIYIDHPDLNPRTDDVLNILCAKPSNWVWTYARLREATRERMSDDKMRAAVRELKEKNYLYMVPAQNAARRYVGWRWFISSTGFSETRKPNDPGTQPKKIRKSTEQKDRSSAHPTDMGNLAVTVPQGRIEDCVISSPTSPEGEAYELSFRGSQQATPDDSSHVPEAIAHRAGFSHNPEVTAPGAEQRNRDLDFDPEQSKICASFAGRTGVTIAELKAKYHDPETFTPLPESPIVTPFNPPPRWDGPGGACMQWLATNCFAQMILEICGSDATWDVRSARMFIKRMRNGGIRTRDIALMARLRAKVVNSEAFVPVTGVDYLLQNWSDILRTCREYVESAIWAPEASAVVRTLLVGAGRRGSADTPAVRAVVEDAFDPLTSLEDLLDSADTVQEVIHTMAELTFGYEDADVLAWSLRVGKELSASPFAAKAVRSFPRGGMVPALVWMKINMPEEAAVLMKRYESELAIYCVVVGSEDEFECQNIKALYGW